MIVIIIIKTETLLIIIVIVTIMMKLIALVTVSVLIDYIATLIIGDLSLENSKLLAYAIEHGLFIPYTISVMTFYAIFSYLLLKFSKGLLEIFSKSTIVSLSLSHLLGWTTWLLRNPLYTQTIMMIPIVSLTLLVTLSGFVILIYDK